MTCSSEQGPISCNDYSLLSDSMSGSDDTDLVKCDVWTVCTCVREEGEKLEARCLCV